MCGRRWFGVCLRIGPYPLIHWLIISFLSVKWPWQGIPYTIPHFQTHPNVTHVRINFEKDSCQNEKVFATCSCPHVGASFLAEDFCSGPLGSGESSDSHHGYGGYGIMDIANITRELCCSAQHERLHVLVHLQCCSSPTCSSFRFFPAMTRAQDNLRIGSYPVPPEACLKREESQKQKSPHITQDHSKTSFKINLTSLLKSLNFARRTFGGKTDLRRSF